MAVTNSTTLASRGFMVSESDGTTALTLNVWSAAIALSENSNNVYSRQAASSSIWEDVVIDTTNASNGDTVRIQLFWDAACTMGMMGPSSTNEFANTTTSCSVGGKRMTFPVAPVAQPTTSVVSRKVWIKIYPSANMTLRAGGIRINLDTERGG